MKIKRSKEDLIFDIIIYVFLGIVLLIIAYPLYFIVIASISDPYMVLNGDVLFLPKGVNINSYIRIFEDKSIWTGYKNTLFYTVSGTLLNVVLTVTLAYPLSRRYFSGRKFIMTILMITMYFSGGLIPTYLLVKGLGLRNTVFALIFTGAISVYNVIIARTYLEANIHSELEEAAQIDGSSQVRFFLQMVLPLSKPIIAVLTLYYAVGHWNDFYKGLIYLDSVEKFPLQLVIRGIIVTTQLIDPDMFTPDELEARVKLAEALKYGIIIISSAPVLILYPFIQRFFIKGVMIGSIKG